MIMIMWQTFQSTNGLIRILNVRKMEGRKPVSGQ